MSEIPARENPFAVMVLDDCEITACVAAATELTKMFMSSANKLAQLQQQTWVETIERDEEDGGDRIVVHDHPKLTWWFEECRKILSDIAKINIEAEAKQVNNKLNLMSTFMSSNNIPKELQEQFTKYAMEQKIGKKAVEAIMNESIPDLPDPKDKNREW